MLHLADTKYSSKFPNIEIANESMHWLLTSNLGRPGTNPFRRVRVLDPMRRDVSIPANCLDSTTIHPRMNQSNPTNNCAKRTWWHAVSSRETLSRSRSLTSIEAPLDPSLASFCKCNPCRRSGQLNIDACQLIRDLIKSARSDPDTFGASNSRSETDAGQADPRGLSHADPLPDRPGGFGRHRLLQDSLRGDRNGPLRRRGGPDHARRDPGRPARRSCSPTRLRR